MVEFFEVNKSASKLRAQKETPAKAGCRLVNLKNSTILLHILKLHKVKELSHLCLLISSDLC